MFTDTPILQPITKGKPKTSPPPPPAATKPDAQNTTTKPCNPNEPPRRFNEEKRFNYGSYKGNNFDPNYQRNYRNRENTQFYQTNSKWNPNYNQNRSYRSNYSYQSNDFDKNFRNSNYRNNYKYQRTADFDNINKFADNTFSDSKYQRTVNFDNINKFTDNTYAEDESFPNCNSLKLTDKNSTDENYSSTHVSDCHNTNQINKSAPIIAKNNQKEKKPNEKIDKQITKTKSAVAAAVATPPKIVKESTKKKTANVKKTLKNKKPIAKTKENGAKAATKVKIKATQSEKTKKIARKSKDNTIPAQKKVKTKGVRVKAATQNLKNINSSDILRKEEIKDKHIVTDDCAITAVSIIQDLENSRNSAQKDFLATDFDLSAATLIENFDSASSPTRKGLLEKSISVEDISSSLLNATTLETLPQTNSKEIATEITNISTALQLSSAHLENLEDSLEITATSEDSVIQQNQQLSTSLLPKQTEIAETFVPKISLIPISRLIASEFSEILLSNTNSDIPKSPRNVFKPNLIKRKRNISTCSNTSTSSLGAEHTIVDKLVTMNKMSLKNIINSTGTTKYDEALQMQARKRLREEIRRQLKSLNIEPPKEQINSDFVPDEIVDAMNLPDVVFDEIRKALGLDLLDCSEDMKSQNLIDFANNNSVFGVHNDVGTSANEKESNHCESADVVEVIPLEEPKKEDDKVRDLELTLEQELLEKRRAVEKAREKVTLIEKKMEERNKVSSTPDKKKKRKKLKKKKESRKTKDKKEIIVIDSSSSSSSGSDSDSSSGSSSGSCSSGSSTSSSSSSDSEAEVARKKAAAKRKGLKLKVDAENVVDSFEKLILPRLRESLIERYRTKHADSTSSKLHFISCICTSEYNSSKFSKLEIAKIQRNIKSSDPSAALDFLMREIINVINKQKLAAKHAEDAAKEKQSPQKSLNDDNQRIAVERLPATVQSQNSMKSVNAAEKLYNSPSRRISKATTQNLQECVSKVLSLYRQEMKAAMQSMQEKNNTNHEAETARAEEQHQSNNKAATNHQQQQPLINANINGNEKNANAANVINATNVETQKQNPINSLINQQQQSQPEQQCKSSESNQHNNDGGKENECRLNISLENLRFSGGQKIINDTVKLNTSMAKDHGPVPSFDATTNINNILCLSASPYTGSCLPTTFPSVDLDVLRKQSIVGQAVADNLRDIDLKLFELNKRKMYLDEMILKLQKDKMEAELQTIKLQNEKFILLNTVMTANVSSEAIISKASSKVESIKNEEQTEIKRPKRESQKVCANNVKRPNMLITVRKHKLAIKRKLKVTAAEKNRMISAKKAKPACNQAESSTNTQAAALAPAVSTATDKTAEKAIEEPCKTPSNTDTNPKSAELQTAGNSSSDKTAKKSAKKHKRSHSKKSKNTNSTEKEKNNSEITTASETTATSSSALPSSSLNPSTNNSSSSTTTSDNKPNHIKKSATVFDYSIMPAGNLEGFHSPITQIQVFENHIYATSECGQLYKFDIKTLKLINSFSKHKEAITQMYLCSEKKMIFTTSLDGYLKKSSLENFELDVHSLNLKEPLQSLDVQWGLAYIGSRWGNIYIYNVMTNSLSDKMLCASETSVIAIKAVKEGPRRVLIVSSKGNLIHLRDAATGLLLRTFDVPDTISIYSMLLHDGVLYCGTQRDDICKYDFVTGSRLGFMKCGNGAVNIKLYKNKFILVGCYDGFIYVLDVVTGEQVGCITGSGKMVLTLEVVDNKIITSAKDNSMKVIDIPKNFGKITVKD